MTNRWVVGITGLAVVLCVGLAGAARAADDAAKSTLENLQTAYNGESNAITRYEAFAVKADEEGYKSVAALFRATANSEAVHARKYAAILKKLGAEPTATREEPKVKSTKENLGAAVKSETAEKDTVYPAFMKQAQTDKNSDALICFKGALAAEASHALLYYQALNELNKWKAEGKEFMVCQVCGYTTMDRMIKKCPICSAPRSKIERVR